jgi:hypothetical protein
VAQGKSVKQIVRDHGRVDNTHSYYQNMQFPFQSIVFDFCLAALDAGRI